MEELYLLKMYHFDKRSSNFAYRPYKYYATFLVLEMKKINKQANVDLDEYESIL